MVNWFRENPEVIPGLAAAFVAFLGTVLTAASIIMSRQQFKAQKESMEADREAAQAERKTARDTVLGDRFARAIEMLRDDSLAIRMGALYELEKIGLEVPDNQEKIVRMLCPYIRNGIEKKELLIDSFLRVGFKRPNEDIFLACSIASKFYEKTGCRVELNHLKAEELDLEELQLQGAKLYEAQFQKAKLNAANFQEAILWESNFSEARLYFANLQGAELTHANLENAKHLTVEQLLSAKYAADAEKLNDNLRAEYDRSKAEHDATKKP